MVVEMNLTTFCKSYNLTYEIVRPLIDKAIIEHRDDCVLILGKQKIKILDDKKFITFINDQKRRDLERCQYQRKKQRDFARGVNTIFTTTMSMVNENANQLEKKIYGMR
jgi:hypothetical protein